jgi:RNA recognition motif-containing protein
MVKEDRRQEHFKVIVLNLTDRVKNAHIEEIFAQYGKINYVDVVRGKSSPKFEHSGKAYISFTSLKSQQDAIELMKGGVIDGAKIEVDELKPLNILNKQPVARGVRVTREYGKLREQICRTNSFNRRGSRSRSPIRNERYSRSRSRSRSPSPRRRSPRRSSRSPVRRNGSNSPSKFRH